MNPNRNHRRLDVSDVNAQPRNATRHNTPPYECFTVSDKEGYMLALISQACCNYSTIFAALIQCVLATQHIQY